ncbi:hypothetical protein ACQP00_29610 [Dactylosporangium sp. CS-047395]|uniref:hypothetical protein n=1 Tax=Dactylosporangium sp. CS-047395 TaxID=3239936 RepID=UPI003D8B9BBA
MVGAVRDARLPGTGRGTRASAGRGTRRVRVPPGHRLAGGHVGRLDRQGRRRGPLSGRRRRSPHDRRRRPAGRIACTNPGGRPPIPTIVLGPAPPPATLPLTPDHAEDVPIDLSGLDDIAWADLEHAQGDAEDVPELLRALADPYGDWDLTLDELVGGKLLHQGTYYSATATALPFLTRLIVSGALPAKERLDLYYVLFCATDRTGAWADDVHRTVGLQLPALLARWDAEPPAIRYALACLAALYPDHAGHVGDDIADLAGQVAGTQPGAYLNLAHALVQGRDDDALAIATDIVAWDTAADPGLLDDPDPDATAAGRAACVLATGALNVLRSTE